MKIKCRSTINTPYLAFTTELWSAFAGIAQKEAWLCYVPVAYWLWIHMYPSDIHSWAHA